MDRQPSPCVEHRRRRLRSSAPHGGAVRWTRAISHAGLTVLLSGVLLGGCDRGSAVREAPSASRIHTDPAVLRVRLDAVHDRTWVLALDHVAVYNTVTQKLIGRIELPPWFVADLVCQPDIAIDRRGTAFISHNLEPRLWEIRIDKFELREHTLRLLGKEHLDTGFGSLAVAPDDTLIGEASTGNSVWRIDLQAATAQEVDASLARSRPKSCPDSLHPFPISQAALSYGKSKWITPLAVTDAAHPAVFGSEEQ
jgi:hypothetical protein